MVAAYAGYGLDGCYAVVVTSAWVLPETRGRVLSVEAGVTA
jgi:hypothetical protein